MRFMQRFGTCRGLLIFVALLMVAPSCSSQQDPAEGEASPSTATGAGNELAEAVEPPNTGTLPPSSLTRIQWFDTFDETLLVPLLEFVARYAEDVKGGLTPEECEERNDVFLEAFGPKGTVDGGSAFRAGPDDVAGAGNELMGASFWMVIGCTSDDPAATELGLEWARRAPLAFDEIHLVVEAERGE